MPHLSAFKRHLLDFESEFEFEFLAGGGAAEDGRKRGLERGAQWERNKKPRRERDREFDG